MKGAGEREVLVVMLRYAVWKKGLGAWRDGRDRCVGTALYRRSQVFLGSDWHHSPFLYCDLWYGLLVQKMSAQKQNDIFESQKVKWDVNESTSTDGSIA